VDGLTYLPYGDARGQPHVVVDGAAQDGTVLTLSHWPGSPTPDDLLADTSAEITLRALAHPERWDGARIVTNNHPDEDGLMGIWVLTDPDAARALADEVVAVATCGDFGVVRDRAAFRCATTLWSFMAKALAAGDDPYAATLPRVCEVLEHPDAHAERWQSADATFELATDALAHGVATIEQVPSLDLAVVTLPADGTTPGADALHSDPGSSAICTATDSVRLFVVQGDRCEYRDRYETWVRYRSRAVPRRVDLTPLAARLTAADPGGARWVYDGVGAITPRLHVVSGVSSLAPDTVRAELEAELAVAPAAWDPDAPGG